MLGLAAGTPQAMHGAILQMFSTGCLQAPSSFLLGMLYERAHHRIIGNFGGLGAVGTGLLGHLHLHCLGSLGLPTMSGFRIRAFRADGGLPRLPDYHRPFGDRYRYWAQLICFGPVQRVLLGEVNEKYAEMADLNLHEVGVLVPLMVLTVAIGLATKYQQQKTTLPPLPARRMKR